MSKQFALLSLSLAFSVSAAEVPSRTPMHSSDSPARHLPRLEARLDSVRVPFVANRGQWNAGVSYRAETFWGSTHVGRDGSMSYVLPDRYNGEPAVIRERLVGAGPAAVRGESRVATQVNYLAGADRAAWRREIPAYGRVSFGQVYPGIELKLQAAGGNVEKLFRVAPQPIRRRSACASPAPRPCA